MPIAVTVNGHDEVIIVVDFAVLHCNLQVGLGGLELLGFRCRRGDFGAVS
jgi:hypothetical protein